MKWPRAAASLRHRIARVSPFVWLGAALALVGPWYFVYFVWVLRKAHAIEFWMPQP